MKLIGNEEKLLKLFSVFSDGGLHEYDQEDQALVFCFESGGGPYECATFYLKFSYVEFFQLPLSLNDPGYAIDEFKAIGKNECESFIHSSIVSQFDLNNDYRCYRFYANNEAKPYYIYCAAIEGWLKPEGWLPPKGYELW